MSQVKYRAVADEGGQWSVMDVETEMPAILDDVPQVALTQDEAEAVAETLNAMLSDEDG